MATHSTADRHSGTLDGHFLSSLICNCDHPRGHFGREGASPTLLRAMFGRARIVTEMFAVAHSDGVLSDHRRRHHGRLLVLACDRSADSRRCRAVGHRVASEQRYWTVFARVWRTYSQPSHRFRDNDSELAASEPSRNPTQPLSEHRPRFSALSIVRVLVAGAAGLQRFQYPNTA